MRIGVFCSGGDAPGMNACVRAVVRATIATGNEVVGIRRGYEGLLEEDFVTRRDGNEALSPRSVSGIVQRGGTILETSRSEEFRTDAGQQKAAIILNRHGIDALVPIGGDGTFHGAVALQRFWDGGIIGCPGTIDNDLLGTDFTIGFHTAVTTAVEAIDKLRDTADSHRRLFLVEVMGRHSGYIALYTSLAGGAELACLPETTTDVQEIAEQVVKLKERGKTSIIIVVAEGDECGGAAVLHEKLKETKCPFPTRVLILGHLQRGGSPVAADRILATRLGDFAVRSLLNGETGSMAGEVHGNLILTPFEQTYAEHKQAPEEMLNLLRTMAH